MASDVSAILRHTDQVVYLNDQEIGVVEEDSFHISTLYEDVVSPQVEKVDWDLDLIQKGGFEHYMLKEIFEQPESLSNTLRGRIDKSKGTAHLQGLELNKERLRDADRIILTACGTAWHAALVGRYMIEELTRRPVDVEYASEMRYRNPIITPDTVTFAISQSGEDSRHVSGDERSSTEGRCVSGHLQCRGQFHSKGNRRRCIPARRTRNRRGIYQSIYVPGGGLGSPLRLFRKDERSFFRTGKGDNDSFGDDT